MNDLALDFDAARLICDLIIANGDLALDATGRTALIVSLGSDSRARPDDPLPDMPAARVLTADDLPPDRRGWVGDALDPAGQALGCRLWLLWREKATESVRRRAIAYAREGLAWAVAAGRPVEVSGGWQGTRLLLHVRLGTAALSIPVARNAF